MFEGDGAMIWLTFGVLLISFVTTHAWWSIVRVVRLRQDVFDIRDHLFDVAHETNTFSDPAYRDARHHLNSIARIAESINLYMLGYLLHANVEHRERPQSDNLVLRKAIDASLEACTERIKNYLLRETFTGLIAMPFTRTIRMTGLVEEQLQKWVRRWLTSSAPESLDRARHRSIMPRV